MLFSLFRSLNEYEVYFLKICNKKSQQIKNEFSLSKFQSGLDRILVEYNLMIKKNINLVNTPRESCDELKLFSDEIKKYLSISCDQLIKLFKRESRKAYIQPRIKEYFSYLNSFITRLNTDQEKIIIGNLISDYKIKILYDRAVSKKITIEYF